jgi:curved DNA-binding protein CbpA
LTPWETLGVSKGASKPEIQKAWKRLAKRWHPDRKSGDETRFKEISEAYDILSSPQKLLRYERTGASGAPPNLELQVRDMIAGMLLRALTTENCQYPIEAVRGQITTEVKSIHSQKLATEASIQRVSRRLKKLKFKGPGPDYIKQMIEFEVAKVTNQLNQNADRLDLLTRALIFLDLYELEGELPTVYPTFKPFITTTWT